MYYKRLSGRSRGALLAVAAMTAMAGSARAATEASTTDAAANDAGSAQVQEVLVTAERRQTNLQNTAIAISAFGGQTLRDRNVENIRDLSGQIPNLSVSRVTISYTTQTYSLRGVGETDPIQEPVLAVYVDDVYVPRQIGSMVEFNDLQRVEVLRGPQGTLYGRNSSAGALRIITEDPSNTFHEKAELGVGSFSAVDARAFISGPIVRDELAGSLSYIHHSRGGVTYDPTLGHDVNRIDLDAFRAKLLWTPTAKLNALFTLNVLRDRSDSRSYIPVVQPGVFDKHLSYSEVDPRQPLNQISGSARITYDLTSNLKVKSITAYGGFNLNPVNYDNDGQAALVQKNLIHYNDQYVTQELQLNGSYGRFDFTSGVFYLFERFYVQRDGYSRKNANPTDPAVTPSNYSVLRAHNFTDTNSFAVFGEGHYKLTDRLTLIAGLRATTERKLFVFNNSALDVNGNVTAASIAGRAAKTWSALTPKLSAQYQWSPDFLTYFTYSKGFKSGGFDNRATALVLAETPFNPEKVTTYEVGAKSEFFDHRLRANLAAFYNDYRDLQVSFYDPAFLASRRGNAGKAHTYGVELETEAKPTSRLGLQFNVGYLFAIYDSYKGAGGAGVDADGHSLINAPRWTVSGAGTYDLPIHVPGNLRLALDVEYQSDTFSSALNRPQDHVPGQVFANGSLIWTTPNPDWTVTLSSRNLLNSQKPVSASYTPSVGIYYQNFPDPRTVMLTVRYQR